MDPMSPGSIPAILFPSPFPTPLATDLSPFESESTITPMTAPSAKRTVATVNPSFLKMFLTLSLSDAPFPQVFPSRSREHQYVLFSQLFFLVLFPSLRDVHFRRSRFSYLLEWISVAVSFFILLCIQYFTLWTESIFYFFREFWIQPLFSCSFFKSEQRISFLAKTKLLHLQLSCFAIKRLEFRGLCLGKNPKLSQ